MNLTLVFAGNIQQFAIWAREAGINPQDSPYKYIHHSGQLKGIKIRDIVLIGTYDHNPKFEELYQEAKSLIR